MLPPLNMTTFKLLKSLSLRRHVFRDLRPYVCTFLRCQNPEKLYATRHEWKYHEIQMHFRRWICQDCGKSYGYRNGLEKHIGKHHSRSVTDSQLQVMTDMCERPIDELEGVTCPICSLHPIILHSLHDHIAEHLEEIALFVLPILSEEDDGDSTNSRIVIEADTESLDILDKDSHYVPSVSQSRENGRCYCPPSD